MNRKTKHVAHFLFTWVSNISLKATLNIFGTKIKCHMDNTHCEKLVLAITHWYYQSILYIGDMLWVLFLSCRSLLQPKNTPMHVVISCRHNLLKCNLFGLWYTGILYGNTYQLNYSLTSETYTIGLHVLKTDGGTFRYDSRSHDTHQDLKEALPRRFCCMLAKTAQIFDKEPLLYVKSLSEHQEEHMNWFLHGRVNLNNYFNVLINTNFFFFTIQSDT